MSMTLILWKWPVVVDADEAKELLEPYYDHGDESAFEPSADLAKVADELLRRFPDLNEGPWADGLPPEATDRLLVIDIRWGADNAIIDAIVELAREHDLVLYDPQGPDVHPPADPVEPTPIPPTRFVDFLKIPLIGIAAAGVFWIGWKIDVPVLDWVLMIVGGFFVSVILFLLWIFMFGPREDATTQAQRHGEVTRPSPAPNVPENG
jgi:hypothetical protein